MKPWSLEAQADRRREQAALIRQKLRPMLDDQARSKKLVWWDQARMPFWASNAFFVGHAEDAAFGNTILRYIRDELKPPAEPNPFPPCSMAGLLAQHDHLLADDVRQYLLEFLEAILPFGFTRDFQFHGYNDNMPVMWTWGLTYGGERLGNRRFTEIAWANLQQLKDLLRRHGAVSEYGLGYASCRLTPIAQIAAHSRDARFRELARDIEARLWAELAGHWNPATAQICGASMRGGPPIQQETPALFWQVFGDDILVRDWRRYYEETPRQFAIELGLDPEEFQMPYALCYNAEFAAADYHVPDSVAELFYRKPPGFTFQCTAESGYYHAGIYCKKIPVRGVGGLEVAAELTSEVVVIKDAPEHGAQAHGLTTYHGRHYAVGSSGVAMFPSSHAFRCTYRRGDGTLGDVFTRYNINDKIAGGRTKNTYAKEPGHPEEKENYNNLYWDSGSYHCLQDANTVLCLQTPQYLEYWDIRSLRTDVFFYQGQGKVQSVVQDGERILINEGKVYLAIHPLIGREAGVGNVGAASSPRSDGPGRGGDAAPTISFPRIKIHEQGEWLVVSLYNYEGPSLQFTPHEIAKLGNGFVFEVRDAEDYASFAAFQEAMSQARIIDQLYSGRRRVHYARPDLRLATYHCPYTQTSVDIVNGLTPEVPQFAYSDGRHKGLPFLDRKPAPGFEDWDWIKTQIERPAETYNPND